MSLSAFLTSLDLFNQSHDSRICAVLSVLALSQRRYEEESQVAQERGTRRQQGGYAQVKDSVEFEQSKCQEKRRRTQPASEAQNGD